MKATVNFEWRSIDEPTFEPEEIIRKALYNAQMPGRPGLRLGRPRTFVAGMRLGHP